MEKQNKACYWFLFFQDKLLLKKNNGSYQIPYQENAPFGTDNSFEVVLDSSLPARAASLSHEITEDEQWIMIGLRTAGIIYRSIGINGQGRRISWYIGIATVVFVRLAENLWHGIRSSLNTVIPAIRNFIRLFLRP